MNPGMAIFRRYQRLQRGTKNIEPNEVHYASELSPDDPRWEAFAKALGVSAKELKDKNLPRKLTPLEQTYEDMAKNLENRVRHEGDTEMLSAPQFDPDLVPIRAPYGRQRYFDPGSLGEYPIMAQRGTEEVPFMGRAARKVQDLSIEALQNLPEWLKSPIRHGVGRVATNVIDPFGYDPESGTEGSKIEQTGRLFSPRNLPHTLSSILHDRPAFNPTDDPTADPEIEIAAEKARRPLFREYFDLPTQDEDNVFIKRGKNFRINPETKNTTAQHVLKQFSGPMYRPDRFTDKDETSLEVGDVPGQPRTNMLSRNYFPEQPDPWDFAPSFRELARTKGKPLDTALFGRILLEAIGKPATLETGGYANPPPNEDVDPAQITGGGLQQGTSNVGLRLFMAGQGQRRKKRKI